MATKLNDTNPSEILKRAAATRQQTTKAKTESDKTAKKDYVRLDMQPDGYDLLPYVKKRAIEVSSDRGRAVSATKYIQELIIADMEENKGKKTKRDKIAKILEGLDDKELSALATILHIQL